MKQIQKERVREVMQRKRSKNKIEYKQTLQRNWYKNEIIDILGRNNKGKWRYKENGGKTRKSSTKNFV